MKRAKLYKQGKLNWEQGTVGKTFPLCKNHHQFMFLTNSFLEIEYKLTLISLIGFLKLLR